MIQGWIFCIPSLSMHINRTCPSLSFIKYFPYSGSQSTSTISMRWSAPRSALLHLRETAQCWIVCLTETRILHIPHGLISVSIPTIKSCPSVTRRRGASLSGWPCVCWTRAWICWGDTSWPKLKQLWRRCQRQTVTTIRRSGGSQSVGGLPGTQGVTQKRISATEQCRRPLPLRMETQSRSTYWLCRRKNHPVGQMGAAWRVKWHARFSCEASEMAVFDGWMDDMEYSYHPSLRLTYTLSNSYRSRVDYS